MDHCNMDRDTRSSSTQFKLDEGFAEDSQQHGEQIQNSFVAWLNTQSERSKAEIAFEILRTLRSTDIAAVVERLNPLLHMDPIERLPPEIISHLFSYLDPSTLLTASLASQTWRERILDPRLWQDLYKAEGWGIDLEAVKAFEEAHQDVIRAEFKSHKGEPQLKKRATSDWLQSTQRHVSADVAAWREQHGVIEADGDVKINGGDEEMTDVPAQSGISPQRPNKRQSQDSGEEMDYLSDNLHSVKQEADTPGQYPTISNLIVTGPSGEARFNWAHVYKQRYKLEDNWLHARGAPFILPHPAYPQEAHTECVYTIQFFGKWLVSGSRDKSLRVWDLETRRLRGKPLLGHSQSVLCLQFDPTPEEDIIISGSSDSSIIVWKFSTGHKLQTIRSAHEESVLNLRFDHRYLVTCSKDKKIKVWNRRALVPNDEDYPKVRDSRSCKVSNYVLDLSGMDISMVEAKLANETFKPLRPFTHLLTFDAHSAAVNAIQIYGDVIVSASGDRTIRVWNVKTGVSLKSIAGHQKGIACVQYDGRRIVSGSSDNSVRIFDPISGTEVACLLGHTNLVRTVQAGFGDTQTIEEDRAAAIAAEEQYMKDVYSGKIVEDRHYSRRIRRGEFGSSRLAMGARLPPGGGGSKWGRIVSGSYDESIIIWKKDSHGNWITGSALRQDLNTHTRARENAPLQAEPARRRNTRLQFNDQAQGVTRMASGQSEGHPGISAVSNIHTMGSGNVMSAAQIVQATVNTSMSSLQTSVRNVMNVNRGMNSPIISVSSSNGGPQPPPRTSSGAASASGIISTPSPYSPVVQNATNQILGSFQSVAQNAVNTALHHGHANINTSVTMSNSPNQSTELHTPPAQIHQHPPQQPPPVTGPIGGNSVPIAPPRPAGHQHHHGQGNNNHAHGHNNGQVSRVFKLQFDARRIVCCSQDSRIIGWDFANGDPDIEECSRFFVGP